MRVVSLVSVRFEFSHLFIRLVFTGENPDRLYGQTRMDGQWNFRNAYDEARKVRDAQDAFCSKVEAGAWDVLEAEGPVEFPDDLQWESLVDVLRGRVKVCPNSLLLLFVIQ